MNTEKLIDNKIESIINLTITKGVQPEELAENIWNKNYINLNLYKENNFIVCSLKFLDEGIEVNMKYIYNSDKYLIRIEEIVNGNLSILWDKDIKLQILIDDLNELLFNEYSKEKAEKILNTLPEKLREYLLKKERSA